MKFELTVDSGDCTRSDPVAEAMFALGMKGMHAKMIPAQPPIVEAPPKLDVKASIQLKTYTIIQDAVERGCQYGVTRAYKHTDKPSFESIVQECESAVMNALCDVIDFD